MRIAIDQEKCTGCSRCSSLFPDLYAMDRGKGFAIVNPITPQLESYCQAAVRACPCNAIAMEEEKLLLYPPMICVPTILAEDKAGDEILWTV